MQVCCGSPSAFMMSSTIAEEVPPDTTKTSSFPGHVMLIGAGDRLPSQTQGTPCLLPPYLMSQNRGGTHGSPELCLPNQTGVPGTGLKPAAC